MAGVEWVWVLGIVRVAVKGYVRGNSAAVHILAGMVAYQAGSQGRRNLTPLQAQGVALLHPEAGLYQLLVMPLARRPHLLRDQYFHFFS